MKLNLEAGAGVYSINGIENSQVNIAGTWYRQPLIVLPERLIHPWTAPPVAQLSAADFACIDDEVRVLLLGTGSRQQFPHPRLLADLAGQGIGMEIMDSAAACRTFNVLVAEGRLVAAALYLGEAGASPKT